MKNWITSDLHFNHANIIRYCNRPFKSVEEMNEALVNNWNRTVDEEDTVFFLGDLAFGHDPLSWLELLKGHIVLIKGSHDRFAAQKSLVLHSEGLDLLLIHDPAEVPQDWHGWVVHGHRHNVDPFFNPVSKRVNVSVEVTNYAPVSVERVVSMIKSYTQPPPLPKGLTLSPEPKAPKYIRGKGALPSPTRKTTRPSTGVISLRRSMR